MGEVVLRFFMQGHVTAAELARDLEGTRPEGEHWAFRASANYRVEPMAVDFEVAPAHVLRIVDSALAGALTEDDLGTLCFALEFSSRFWWDADCRRRARGGRDRLARHPADQRPPHDERAAKDPALPGNRREHPRVPTRVTDTDSIPRRSMTTFSRHVPPTWSKESTVRLVVGMLVLAGGLAALLWYEPDARIVLPALLVPAVTGSRRPRG